MIMINIVYAMHDNLITSQYYEAALNWSLFHDTSIIWSHSIARLAKGRSTIASIEVVACTTKLLAALPWTHSLLQTIKKNIPYATA